MSERHRIIERFSPAERIRYSAMGGRLHVVQFNRRESDMLVLGRERDDIVEIQDAEGWVVGTINVVSIRGSKIRLGFDFPPQWKIYRKEIADTIRREAAAPVPAVASRQEAYVTPQRKS